MGLQTESYRRGFAYSSLLSVIDSVLGFVPSMLVAAFFGAQTVTDVYYYCAGLITLVVTYFRNINVAVVIPEYMRIRIQEGQDPAMRFLNTIWLGALGVWVLLAWLVELRPVHFVGAISRFPAAALEPHKTILLWAAPLLPLQAMVCCLSDALHSHRYFTLPMLSNIINRVMVIAALLLGRTRMGIVSMLVGLQVSSLLQLALLVYLLRRRLGWRWAVGAKAVRKETRHNAAYSALGGLASLGASYIPLMLFSGLAAGEVTGLNIAQRLVGLPMAFLAGQAAAVMGVKLNELFAQVDESGMRRTFESSAVLLALGMSLLSAASWVLAPDLIAALYQRGAFDARSTALTAGLFGMLAWSLPALGVNALVARVFMAGQRIREAFWCQVVANVVLMGSIAWAVHLMGGRGYPIAFAMFYAAYLVALAPVVSRLFPSLEYTRVLARCGRIVVLAVAIGLAGRFAAEGFMPRLNPWWRLVMLAPAVSGVLLWMALRLNLCPEAGALWAEVRARLWDRPGHGGRGGRVS